MLLLAEEFAALGDSERNIFGNLVGMGDMGYIFEYSANPDLVIKLVQIRPYVEGKVKPFRETFSNLRSPRAKKVAINELQSNLFRKLEDAPISSSLPKIYEFSYGGVTSELRDAMKESYSKYGWADFGASQALKSVLREFRLGNRYAYWIMEKIPCTSYNEWCGKLEESPQRIGWSVELYRKLASEEQHAYESLLSDLYHYMDTIVRDMANVKNIGFRNDGSPVWFDPVVSSWPIQSWMEDSEFLVDREKYDLFVSAFGIPQMFLYQEALDSGEYFSHRHDMGALMAEG